MLPATDHNYIMNLFIKVIIGLFFIYPLFLSSFKNIEKFKLKYIFIILIGFISIGVIPVGLEKAFPEQINSDNTNNLAAIISAVTGIFFIRLIFNSIFKKGINTISKKQPQHNSFFKNSSQYLYSFHSFFLFIGGLMMVVSFIISDQKEADPFQNESFSLKQTLKSNDTENQIIEIGNHIIDIKEVYGMDSLTKEEQIFLVIDKHNSKIIYDGYSEYMSHSIYQEQSNFKNALGQINANKVLEILNEIKGITISRDDVSPEQIDSLYQSITPSLSASMIVFVKENRIKFK